MVASWRAQPAPGSVTMTRTLPRLLCVLSLCLFSALAFAGDGDETLENFKKFFKAYDMPSTLLPNIQQRVWRLRCPQCSAEHERPFEVNHCGCGLSMKLDGSLYVWREKELANVRA